MTASSARTETTAESVLSDWQPRAFRRADGLIPVVVGVTGHRNPDPSQCAELESDVVIGFAAWRVGPGDGDVIAHGGAGDPAADAGRAGADVPPHHAWLETGGHVFDVTTHQLARKAAEAGPQRETPISVTWCPEFVLTPRASLASFARVRQPVVGLMYYERDAYLQSVLGTRASEPDSAQVAAVERIYRELVMAPGTDRQSPAA